jgi:oxygen-independent coproporphyrinogen-3 oxidase
MIERVMCDFALDLRDAAPESQTILRQALARMAPLEEAGLVQLDALALRVTPAGRRFVRQVAACFDAFLARSAKGHSAAV